MVFHLSGQKLLSPLTFVLRVKSQDKLKWVPHWSATTLIFNTLDYQKIQYSMGIKKAEHDGDLKPVKYR